MKNKTAKGAGVLAAVASIVAAVFAVEGGYVNNKNDPGGATNHGVTEAVARQHGYEGHMRDLPKETAVDIYTVDYIEKPGYLPFVEMSPVVAEEVIDSGVNAGTGRSSRWLQSSINYLNASNSTCPQLAVDGRVGPGTVAAYQCLERVRGKSRACSLTVKLLDAHQAQHYMRLADADPKFRTFIVGWVDNRVGNAHIKDC